MRFLLNILWVIFGGLISFLVWILAGCLWCITIIGIPWGKKCSTLRLPRLHLSLSEPLLSGYMYFDKRALYNLKYVLNSRISMPVFSFEKSMISVFLFCNSNDLDLTIWYNNTDNRMVFVEK